ncbi:MAG TPA: type II toxin-antitoxin system PemK/MazF family toxin [Phycisphaerae bacterium]|nr:type II toxin-antitoxin system PemK/MazF family toxin [Phycisphaerae bacterium]
MNPGELYYADLYEAGVRPVLIVSRESLNRGGYAVAIPLTSSHFERRSRLPNCVPFRAGQFGLTVDCAAQCEAILSIERSQIDLTKGLIGQVDESTMREVIRAAGYVMESECEPTG